MSNGCVSYKDRAPSLGQTMRGIEVTLIEYTTRLDLYDPDGRRFVSLPWPQPTQRQQGNRSTIDTKKPSYRLTPRPPRRPERAAHGTTTQAPQLAPRGRDWLQRRPGKHHTPRPPSHTKGEATSKHESCGWRHAGGTGCCAVGPGSTAHLNTLAREGAGHLQPTDSTRLLQPHLLCGPPGSPAGDSDQQSQRPDDACRGACVRPHRHQGQQHEE